MKRKEIVVVEKSDRIIMIDFDNNKKVCGINYMQGCEANDREFTEEGKQY